MKEILSRVYTGSSSFLVCHLEKQESRGSFLSWKDMCSQYSSFRESLLNCSASRGIYNQCPGGTRDPSGLVREVPRACGFGRALTNEWKAVSSPAVLLPGELIPILVKLYFQWDPDPSIFQYASIPAFPPWRARVDHCSASSCFWLVAAPCGESQDSTN